MGRPPALPADKKLDLVLAVLSGEESAADAARRARVSEQSVWNWRRQFIEAGRLGLAGEVVSRDASREDELSREISVLKSTIADLYVEVRNHRRRLRPCATEPTGASLPRRALN
jgi:transposase